MDRRKESLALCATVKLKQEEITFIINRLKSKPPFERYHYTISINQEACHASLSESMNACDGTFGDSVCFFPDAVVLTFLDIEPLDITKHLTPPTDLFHDRVEYRCEKFTELVELFSRMNDVYSKFIEFLDIQCEDNLSVRISRWRREATFSELLKFESNYMVLLECLKELDLKTESELPNRQKYEKKAILFCTILSHYRLRI